MGNLTEHPRQDTSPWCGPTCQGLHARVTCFHVQPFWAVCRSCRLQVHSKPRRRPRRIVEEENDDPSPGDDLPQEATSTLLGVYEQLSLSRHAGLARWAGSVSDALLVRLASVMRGARVDVIDFEPCGPLAWLDAAELKGLHSVMLAGAEANYTL